MGGGFSVANLASCRLSDQMLGNMDRLSIQTGFGSTCTCSWAKFTSLKDTKGCPCVFRITKRQIRWVVAWSSGQEPFYIV